MRNLKIKKDLSEETIQENRMPATLFLGVRKSDNKVIGTIQIRHKLNESLLKNGGHIGDGVRPSERRKGYASWMLNSIKPFCKSIGLDKILVCCFNTNVGSRKTILKNGGIYDGIVYYELKNKYLERYWIDVTNS